MRPCHRQLPSGCLLLIVLDILSFSNASLDDVCVSEHLSSGFIADVCICRHSCHLVSDRRSSAVICHICSRELQVTVCHRDVSLFPDSIQLHITYVIANAYAECVILRQSNAFVGLFSRRVPSYLLVLQLVVLERRVIHLRQTAADYRLCLCRHVMPSVCASSLRT